MAKRYSDYAEELSQQLIRIVETGQAPWQSGYTFEMTDPESYSTEKQYRGGNALRLMLTGLERGYDDSRWITKNQALKEGGSIADTKKGVPILFFTDTQNVKVKNQDTGEIEDKKVKLSRPVLKVSTVFNIQEVDGIPHKEHQTAKQLGWENANLLQNIEDLTKIDIQVGTPSYNRLTDIIKMPPPETYKNEQEYASTLIHETIHWTGNEKRLDRLKSRTRGDNDYAREELVAEIGAMLTAQQAGFEIDNGNSESYVKGWWQPLKEKLEKDPTEIMRIAKDAYSARDYILEGKELDRLDEVAVSHKIELTAEEATSGRVNLDIPFSEKNQAKALAKSIEVDLQWDKVGKTWFITVEDSQNIGNLAKYRTTPEVSHSPAQERLDQFKENAESFFNGIDAIDDEIVATAHSHVSSLTQGQRELSFSQVLNQVHGNHKHSEQLIQAIGELDTQRTSEMENYYDTADLTPEKALQIQKLNADEYLHAVGDSVKTLSEIEDVTVMQTHYNINNFLSLNKGLDFDYMVENIATYMEESPQTASFQKRLLEQETKHNEFMSKPFESKEEVPSVRRNFDIPFALKDATKEIAKENGVALRWDKKHKTWFADISDKNSVGASKIKSFLAAQNDSTKAEPAHTNTQVKEALEEQKVYLSIPFEKKDLLKAEAKALEIPLKWDGVAKSWYTLESKMPDSFKEYLPNSAAKEPKQEESIFEAFAKIGVVDPPSQVSLDGKFHRLKDVHDKSGKASISYKGYDNGIPNATITNHKTGETVKWVGKSAHLTAEEIKELEILRRNNSEKSRAEMLATRNEVAKESQAEVAAASLANPEHQYLKAKGILPHDLKADDRGNLLVTLQNVDGEVRSIQRINREGGKFYTKGGEKTGNFKLFGELTDGSPIIIAEGAATAATLHEVSGQTTVAALDSGNLKDVAQNIKEKFPQSALIIAADNDHQKPLLSPPKKNVGLEKAREAASEVGAILIYPKFDPAEADHKELSDYNDIAKSFGKEKVAEDVSQALAKARVIETRSAGHRPLAPQQKPRAKQSNER